VVMCREGSKVYGYEYLIIFERCAYTPSIRHDSQVFQSDSQVQTTIAIAGGSGSTQCSVTTGCGEPHARGDVKENDC
jgi:hypothetical protein